MKSWAFFSGGGDKQVSDAAGLDQVETDAQGVYRIADKPREHQLWHCDHEV